MASSVAERQARARAKKKEKGLKQINLWVYSEEEVLLKRFLKDMREAGFRSVKQKEYEYI